MKPNWRGRKQVEACLSRGGFMLGTDEAPTAKP